MKLRNLQVTDAAAALVLCVLAVLQWNSLITTVKDFSSTILVSPDTVYQTERLLLNARYPVQQITAFDIDYGSELLYLAHPLRWLGDAGGSHNIRAFQLLIGVHLASALLALVLVYALCRRREQAWLGVILLLALSVSPLLTAWMSSIKPDANSVMLLLVAGLWCLLLYVETGRFSFFAGALTAAAGASAIKWWGAFLLPALVYCAFRFEREKETRFMPRAVMLAAGAAAFLLFWLVYSHGTIVHEVVWWSGIQIKKAPLLAIVFGLSALCAGAIPYLPRLARVPMETGFIFGVLFLLIELPFLLSKMVTASFLNYSKYFLYSPQNLASSGAEPGGPLVNAGKWFSDAVSGGFLSWAGFAGLALSVVILFWNRKKQNDPLLPILAWFLLPMIAFLFLLIQKKNAATQAMIQPVLFLFIGVCLFAWAARMNWPRMKWVILMGFFCMESLLANLNHPISEYYERLHSIPAAVKDFANEAEMLTNQPCKPRLFACNRVLPLPEGESHKIWTPPCTSEAFIKDVRVACDYVVVAGTQDSAPEFLKEYQPVRTLRIPRQALPSAQWEYQVYAKRAY